MICFVGISVRDCILWKWLWEDSDVCWLTLRPACLHNPHVPWGQQWQDWHHHCGRKARPWVGVGKTQRFVYNGPLPELHHTCSILFFPVLKCLLSHWKKTKRSPQLVSFTFTPHQDRFLRNNLLKWVFAKKEIGAITVHGAVNSKSTQWMPEKPIGGWVKGACGPQVLTEVRKGFSSYAKAVAHFYILWWADDTSHPPSAGRHSSLANIRAITQMNA